MRNICLFCCVAAMILVASCRVANPVVMPVIREMPDSFGAVVDTASIANRSWKTYFNDQFLATLIDSALRRNPDLSVALERVKIARARLGARRAALLPTADAMLSAGADRFGKYTMNGVGNFDTNLSPNIKDEQHIPTSPTPDYFAGFRSSWEIDLWGKLRSRKKAALAEVLATEKGRQYAITNLVAEVATRYYDLLALDNELEIVLKNVQLQQEALQVVQVQKQGGRATELAVQQFIAQLANTRAIEFTIRQQLVQAENELNTLLGRYPQPIARDTSIIGQPLPVTINTGSPEQLLIRRPDIQQAEWQLQAAGANVKAARAAFLPSLKLTPYIGVNSFRSALLFDPASIAYGALANAAAPLFNRGAIKAEYDMANARNRQAVHRYQQLLLNGYSEVVTHLKSIENSTHVFRYKRKEVQELTNAVATARDLYLAGYANYLEVITAQKGVLEAELRLTENKKQLFHSVINLYRSLGGGWN